MSSDPNNQMFNEYIIQGEGTQKQRAKNWQIAIGLQDVDRLQNSAYLFETARQHIEGDIDIAAVQRRIEDYYRTEEGRKLATERTDEADIVAARISGILAEKTFSFIPAIYANLHKRLFSGVFPHAGEFRKVNISKKEWVLDGESVLYTPCDVLSETLEFDFKEERDFSYANLSAEDAVRHIAKFISGIWQIHPFMEGNTRTTAVFTILYLRMFGFKACNEPFRDHSWYFRNALVRASYSNYSQGISATTAYLERFFENLLFAGKNELKNRYCHIRWENEENSQSANPKCKNCTLEEAAVLKLVAANPKITQKMIAREIKKSERTVKSITVSLQDKGLLFRKDGKRNGSWVVKDE